MPKFPFTYFDYIVYLIVGFPVIWVLNYSKEGLLHSSIASMSETEKWLFLALAAFLAGQIISFFAHHVVQEKIIVWVLGRPSDNLLGVAPPLFGGLKKKSMDSLGSYQGMEAEECMGGRIKVRKCLPKFARDKAKTRAAAELDVSEHSISPKLVWSQAFRHARWNKHFAEIYADLFVTLIFSRNMGVALFLTAIIMVVNKFIHGDDMFSAESSHVFCILMFVSVILLWRFIVMFRAYSKAVLMNYAFPTSELCADIPGVSE